MKSANFCQKNVDVSRNLGVCNVIDTFLDLLLLRYNCATFHHCGIYVTDFK